MALSLLQSANQHEAQTLSVLQTVPGIGKILSRVLRYEIHAIGRFPRVQAFASYARWVKGSKASAGKRVGPAGQTIGPAPRTGAFAAAAPVCLRHHPNGQQLLTRLANNHGTGKALTILAPQLARAVESRLKRKTAVDMASFFRA